MGYLGINVPEALGGAGLGNLEALIVVEEVSRVSAAVAFPIFESCVGPVRAIERFASDELRERVVPEVCRGETVVAIAMSEPNAGSALTPTCRPKQRSMAMKSSSMAISAGAPVAATPMAMWCIAGCRMTPEREASALCTWRKTRRV